MITFSYKAKSAPGQVVEGLVESENRAAAVDKLARMGYFPIHLEERRETAAMGSGFLGRVPLKDVGLFTRQLSDLLESGVPLMRALAVCQRQTENRRLSAVAREIIIHVEGGKSFSEALKIFPDIFSPLYVSLVQAGEAAGVLGTALYRLSEFTDQEEDLRAQVRAAMAYPLLIAIVGAATVIFMLVFMVPRLSGMFMEMGQDLPFVTRALLAFSRLLAHHGWWTALASIGGAAAFLRGGRRRSFRSGMDRFILKIPVLGDVVQKLAMARFARTLETLLSGGVPILEALKIVSEAIGQERLKKQVLNAARLVREGASLAESLREMPDFPAFVSNMVAVGEEGNILEKSLGKVGGTYEREAARAIKMAVSLLEPAMILAVGSVVGFIVVAMLLPIFQISAFVK